MKKRIFLLLVVCLAGCAAPADRSLTGSDVWRQKASRPFMEFPGRGW